MSQCKNRRPLRPLNDTAVKKANSAQPKCGSLAEKTQWINVYIAAGGAWECADPANKKIDEPLEVCPNKKEDKKHSIKIMFVGGYTIIENPDLMEERAYGEELFSGSLPDSRNVEGRLDNSGVAEYQDIPAGTCEFEFSDFYSAIKKNIAETIDDPGENQN